VVTAVADRVPERVWQVVYVDAFVPLALRRFAGR
jgi:hypothetical protein